MFVKVISKSEHPAVTIFETETIKMEHPPDGSCVVTLLPAGQVLEFMAIKKEGGIDREQSFTYGNEIYLMNNEGKTIDTLML